MTLLKIKGNLCKKQYTNIQQLENHKLSLDHNHRARRADLEALTYGIEKEMLAADEERRAKREAVMTDVKPASGPANKKKGGFKNSFVVVEQANPETQKRRQGHWKKVGEPTPPPPDSTDVPATSVTPQPAFPSTAPATSVPEVETRPWSSYNFDGEQFESHQPEDATQCDENCH